MRRPDSSSFFAPPNQRPASPTTAERNGSGKTSCVWNSYVTRPAWRHRAISRLAATTASCWTSSQRQRQRQQRPRRVAACCPPLPPPPSSPVCSFCRPALDTCSDSDSTCRVHVQGTRAERWTCSEDSRADGGIEVVR